MRHQISFFEHFLVFIFELFRQLSLSFGQVGQNKEEKRITSTEKDKANENI
jgi:hypothetical protein